MTTSKSKSKSKNRSAKPLLNPTWFKRQVYGWVRCPWRDHLVVLPLLFWLFGGMLWSWPLFMLGADDAVRRAIFQSIATLAGTTVGLTLTSVSILINLIRTPLGSLDKILENEDKRKVGSVFLTALPKLALAMLVALCCLVLDDAWEAGNLRVVLDFCVFWFALASLSAMARIVWVLKRLLDLSI